MIATSKSWIWSPKKDSLFCKDTWRTGDMCQWFLVTLQEFILRVKDGLEVCLCEVRQYLCMYYIYIWYVCTYDTQVFFVWFLSQSRAVSKEIPIKALSVPGGLEWSCSDSRRLQFYRKILSRTPFKTLEVCMSKLPKKKTTPCFQQTAGDVSIGWFFLVVVVGERISVQLYRSHRI